MIPAVTGLESDGRAWHTDIGSTVPFAERAGAHASSVEGRVSRTEWASQVHAILEAIAAGELAKAVLAREVVVHADAVRRAPWSTVCARPKAAAWCSPPAGTWAPRPSCSSAGARRSCPGRWPARSHGATDAGDSAAEAALAASVKDGLEHRLVVDAVVDDLRVRCRHHVRARP